MVTGDKVRLNHELLIWVGFTRHGRIWTYPDGVDIDNGTPYFPEDIRACFKWLVPKLSSFVLHSLIGRHESMEEWRANVQTYHEPETTSPDEVIVRGGRADGITPALAICLAIQKLIRSK